MPSSIVLTAVFVLVVSVRDFAFRSTSFDSASFINSPATKALPNRDVCHSCRSASNRVRPSFRECQCRCREGSPLALARPGLPLGLNAVADEARAKRRYQYSAYAVAPVGDLVRLRVYEQRLADIEPSERDVFAVRLDVLSPEVAGISSLGKARLRTGDRCVGKFGIEHALYSRLQPARHRDVVGIDPPAPFCQLALQVEDVAGPNPRKDNPPIARIC